MKIIDSTTYFEEDMMIDLRLNILNDYVDHFIISEARFSHSGAKKEIKFDINKFPKFKDKITHLIVDNDPTDNNSELNDRSKSIKRISYQRDHISSILNKFSGDDYIIHSDNDEIPNLEEFDFKIKSLKWTNPIGLSSVPSYTGKRVNAVFLKVSKRSSFDIVSFTATISAFGIATSSTLWLCKLKEISFFNEILKNYTKKSNKDNRVTFYIPDHLKNQKNIELSIVVPAYNEKKTIAEKIVYDAIEKIKTKNIDLRYFSEIEEVIGDQVVEGLRIVNNKTGKKRIFSLLQLELLEKNFQPNR